MSFSLKGEVRDAALGDQRVTKRLFFCWRLVWYDEPLCPKQIRNGFSLSTRANFQRQSPKCQAQRLSKPMRLAEAETDGGCTLTAT